MSDSILLIGHPSYFKYLSKSLILFGSSFDYLVEERYKSIFIKEYGPNCDNVLFIDSFSNSLVTEFFKNKVYNYIFVYIFSLKVPEDLFRRGINGAYNIHPSYLPAFSGPDPWFWAICKQVEYGGVTLHILTDDYDAGDIVAQVKIPFHPLETAGTYKSKCHASLTKLMHLAYDNLHNNVSPVVQNERLYFKKASENDCIINWNFNAKDIHALVRACNPDKSCITRLNNRLCEILEISITKKKSTIPGHILVTNNRLLVACNDYYVSINLIFVNQDGFFSGCSFIKHTNLG